MKDITPRQVFSLSESVGRFEGSVALLVCNSIDEAVQIADNFPMKDGIANIASRDEWKAFYLAVARHAVKLLEEAT